MNTKITLTVSLVDDEHTYRNKIVLLLGGDDGIVVLDDFSNYQDALNELSKEWPDVIFMDIQLTGEKTGIDLVADLRRQGVESKIVMLTSFDDDARVFQSLKNGANGYLIKGEPKDVVLQSVADVMEGKAPMSARIATLLIQHFNELGNETIELSQLTSRENEIIEKLSKGYLYKEVADQLDISPETVKKHAGSIYRKLHVSNKTEAINIFNKR